MNEILDDQIFNPKDPYPRPELKTRHGCVTAWLTLMIVANVLSIVASLFLSGQGSEFLPESSTLMFIITGLLAGANIFFAVMLFQWKKMGFYGFVGSAILAFGLNMSVGVSPMQSIGGLVGIAILYGILQISNDHGVSAWDNLE